MNIDFIERLIDIAKASSVAEIEYQEGDRKVRVGLVEGVVIPGTAVAPIQPAVVAHEAGIASHSPQQTPVQAHGVTQKSTLTGMFYRAPAPDQPPFVQEGDLVEEGQTLAIVEAMKMLNPLEADVRGRIVAIHATDGDMVEAGMPLFMITPEEA